ncbi:MAG: hypothetical protein PVH26_11020 [Desulfosarcina sp.]
MSMNVASETQFVLDQYLGCFGKYRRNDPVCGKRCALNLRCAIEYDQNERYEILKELVSADAMALKVN